MMKILKYLIFLVLIISIGGAIYFGTKDGTYDISENRIIEAPAEVIYNHVKDFKKWESWGPWMEKDENIQISYAEKTEGEGGSYSWMSEVLGDGYMETVKVIPNKEMSQKIKYTSDLGEGESDVRWLFDSTETPNQTKVTWGIKGEQSFMEKVYRGITGRKMEPNLREMYANGLANLDKLVIEEMDKFSINVDGITQYGGGYYMYNTAAANQTDIGAKMAPMMGQVMNYMQQNNLQMAGAPFTIYNQVDELNGTFIFSTCIPVRERVITPSGSPVLCGYMAPGPTLKTTMKGKYENLPAAYSKAQEYIAANNLQVHPTAKMFEVYLTDPTTVPNPAEWETQIYIPLLAPPNIN